MIQEELTMGRKAESIYTTRKRNQAICDKELAHRNRRTVYSFKHCIRDMVIQNICYVYINGISMPVSRI